MSQREMFKHMTSRRQHIANASNCYGLSMLIGSLTCQLPRIRIADMAAELLACRSMTSTDITTVVDRIYLTTEETYSNAAGLK